MSPKSVERTLADPEYRKVADEVRKRGASEIEALLAQVNSIAGDLLEAEIVDSTTHERRPDLDRRAKGLELLLKHEDVLRRLMEEAGAEDVLPAGAVIFFPLPEGVELEDTE